MTKTARQRDFLDDPGVFVSLPDPDRLRCRDFAHGPALLPEPGDHDPEGCDCPLDELELRNVEDLPVQFGAACDGGGG